MKNTITFLLTALSLAIIATSHCAAFSGNGAGTVGDPYQITDVYQLQEMNDAKSSHYILMNNIDASATSGWNGGAGFVPIGSFGNDFTGSLDGRGYVISGLYINRPTTDFVGLFGLIGSGASATDVGLTDVDISGDRNVGGFCGYNFHDISECYSTGSVSGGDDNVGGFCGWNDGDISECYSTGSVSGDDRVGGFCGRNDGDISECYSTGSVSGDDYVGGFCGINYFDSDISDCYSTGNVSGDDNVGGFCGRNYDAISECYSTGSVSGNHYVGGFCGYNYHGSIDNCYSTGSVSGNISVGGFCGGNGGYNDHGIIDNCYSTGSVSGNSNVGGFCGLNAAYENYGIIDNCYSTGQVTGNSNVGGFCGKNNNDINYCYWDTQTSGKTGSDGGIGKTTAEMKTQSTFTDAGWDFTNTWYMWGCPFDYPKLEPDPTPTVDVWVSSNYCDGCGNDGHYWNCDAFDNMNDALDRLPDGGALHLAEDWTITGDLTLKDGKKYALGDYDLFVSGYILGADNNNYIVTDGDGRLIMTSASSQTWTLGTAELGLCPLVITAPASNTFGVNLKDYTDESICNMFPSRCYWDIDHTGGGDAAQLDFIYQKANVPSGRPDLTVESYALHYTGGKWENITPTGASTVDNWDGDTDYYLTTVSGVSSFSPFAPSYQGAIPTLSERAAIALGGLLLILGGWFVWRRIG